MLPGSLPGSDLHLRVFSPREIHELLNKCIVAGLLMAAAGGRDTSDERGLSEVQEGLPGITKY